MDMAHGAGAVRLVPHGQEEMFMNDARYFKAAAASMLSAALFCTIQARADDVSTPSKHQFMKDCMAKQKASDSGRLKEDMEKTCRDLSKTEKQNADRAAAAQGTSVNAGSQLPPTQPAALPPSH
jgi:hypothetical protein